MWRCVRPPLRRRSHDGGETRGAPAAADVGPVGRGPPDAPAAARHALTPAALAPPGLRVVTYNILADQYAATERAQQVLFAYCAPECGPRPGGRGAAAGGPWALQQDANPTL